MTPPETGIPAAVGRTAGRSLQEFAAREDSLLRKLASLAPLCPGGRMQLLDDSGTVAWSSGEDRSAGTAPVEQPLRALPGRLRIDPAEGDGRALGEVWLRTAALVVDSVAGISAEMSGLIDEHIALTDQLLAMFNIARGTRGHWDLEEQLRVVVHEAVRVTGMDAGVLWIYCPQAERFVVHPEDPDLLALVKLMAANGCLDEQPEPGALQQVSRGRYHACVVAPFQAGPNRKGRLGLLTRQQDRPILARDTKLAQALADLAGTYAETASLQEMAVENLKVARELEIARSIQQLLVPRVLEPTRTHEITAYYEPAREVGGDFYLALPLPGEQLLFSVGDVAGKGVPAALLMSMTRTATMTLAGEVSSPAMVIRRIGRILYRDLDRAEKMVTMVLAYYNSSTSSLVIANAGHSPVFIAKEGRPIVAIEPTAPPLGVVPTPEVTDQVFTFQKGDVLVATSDGFSEARNERGEFFGVERLAALVEEVRGRSAKEILRHLVRSVAEFSGTAPQADDQTAVVLKGGRPG